MRRTRALRPPTSTDWRRDVLQPLSNHCARAMLLAAPPTTPCNLTDNIRPATTASLGWCLIISKSHAACLAPEEGEEPRRTFLNDGSLPRCAAPERWKA